MRIRIRNTDDKTFFFEAPRLQLKDSDPCSTLKTNFIFFSFDIKISVTPKALKKKNYVTKTVLITDWLAQRPYGDGLYYLLLLLPLSFFQERDKRNLKICPVIPPTPK